MNMHYDIMIPVPDTPENWDRFDFMDDEASEICITESEMLETLFFMTGDVSYAIREYQQIMQEDNQ